MSQYVTRLAAGGEGDAREEAIRSDSESEEDDEEQHGDVAEVRHGHPKRAHQRVQRAPAQDADDARNPRDARNGREGAKGGEHPA